MVSALRCVATSKDLHDGHGTISDVDSFGIVGRGDAELVLAKHGERRSFAEAIPLVLPKLAVSYAHRSIIELKPSNGITRSVVEN